MTAVIPSIAVLLPEGWIRLRFDDTIDAQIAEIITVALRGVDARRRDMARAQLRTLLTDTVESAAGRAYELWMPIAPTGGVTIPLTVVIAPPPTAPDPARSVGDHLVAFAATSAGSAFIDVGGRPAVRLFADLAGAKNAADEWVEVPRRRVTTLVSPGPDGEWIVFFAEIIVPQEGADEIVAACEFFIDAFLRTVRFAPVIAPVRGED